MVPVVALVPDLVHRKRQGPGTRRRRYSGGASLLETAYIQRLNTHPSLESRSLFNIRSQTWISRYMVLLGEGAWVKPGLTFNRIPPKVPFSVLEPTLVLYSGFGDIDEF